MSNAIKVWCPDDEGKPEGLFNKYACPDAPANWFREEPALAAELFALERWGSTPSTITRRVIVLDEQHVEHTFQTTVFTSPEVTVKPL